MYPSLLDGSVVGNASALVQSSIQHENKGTSYVLFAFLHRLEREASARIHIGHRGNGVCRGYNFNMLVGSLQVGTGKKEIFSTFLRKKNRPMGYTWE